MQKSIDAQMRSHLDALALTNAPMVAVDATRLPRGAKFEVKPGKAFMTNGDPAGIIMPFKLTKTETFRVPVTIESLDENGRTLKEVVHCTYLRPNEAELEEWNGKDNKAVLYHFLKNVEGMTDKDPDDPDNKAQVAIPFEGAYREAFLNYPPAIFSCAAAFWQGARLGRVKN